MVSCRLLCKQLILRVVYKLFEDLKVSSYSFGFLYWFDFLHKITCIGELFADYILPLFCTELFWPVLLEQTLQTVALDHIQPNACFCKIKLIQYWQTATPVSYLGLLFVLWWLTFVVETIWCESYGLKYLLSDLCRKNLLTFFFF